MTKAQDFQGNKYAVCLQSVTPSPSDDIVISEAWNRAVDHYKPSSTGTTVITSQEVLSVEGGHVSDKKEHIVGNSAYLALVAIFEDSSRADEFMSDVRAGLIVANPKFSQLKMLKASL